MGVTICLRAYRGVFQVGKVQHYTVVNNETMFAQTACGLSGHIRRHFVSNNQAPLCARCSKIMEEKVMNRVGDETSNLYSF